MIEPTEEMRKAFLADHEDACDGVACGRAECLDVRLAAVLAVVERDYDVRPPKVITSPCGAAGPDGLTCQRNPHTPDSLHGSLAGEGLVRW